MNSARTNLGRMEGFLKVRQPALTPNPLSRRSRLLALPGRWSGGRGAGVRGSYGPSESVKPS